MYNSWSTSSQTGIKRYLKNEKESVGPHWKVYQVSMPDWNVCHFILAIEDAVIDQESALESFYWKILLQDVNWWSEVWLSKNKVKIHLSHNHQHCV